MPNQVRETGPRLSTARLELIAADLALARADLRDLAEFSRLLDAEVPDAWPPPLNDDNSKKYTLNYFELEGAPGWGAWYYVWRSHSRVAVGMGGFKGAPVDGTVEVGYSVLPEFQRKGFASEAVGALLEWAFEQSGVERVAAETLPALSASIGVLKKLGFTHVGPGSEDGAIRFELPR